MTDPSILDCDVFALAALALDAYPEPVPFEDFGPYEISKEPIGRGGMGEVFLAYDRTAGRQVAIKFLGAVSSDPDLRTRFDHEIKVLAQLEHPFIARLYDVGVNPDGAPFFVMEYVEGKPFDRFCYEQNCCLADHVRLFRCVCEAVQYAHSRLIVHRDLKPSNILVKADGTPKLLDFGIAKQLENLAAPLTQTQTEARFTFAYAAPEQLRREQVGVFTDVYALGVILYEILAGRRPYDLKGRTPGQAEMLITDEHEPQRPSLSPSRIEARRADWTDLDVLCLKAMKKDVQRRYPSVVELIQDIDHFLNGEPLKARPDTMAYRANKFVRRNRRTVLASAAVFALIAGLVVFYTVRLAKARDMVLTQAARTQRIQRLMLNTFGGDYNSAPSAGLRVVDVLDRGVKTVNSMGRDPALQADLYSTLGSIYQSLGELGRADLLLQSGVAKRRSAFGSDTPDFAKGLVTLATLRVDQAQFADAERLAREALAIDDRHLGPDDPGRADALSTLGEVLEHRGAYQEAIKVLEEAIRIQSLPTAEPADLAESLGFLANAQHFLGNDTLALDLDRRVLALDRQIYGDKHPSVAEDLTNLGQYQEQLGRYGEAERSQREGLAIVQAWYGKDHLEAALDAEGLAGTLIYEREYDEAVRLLEDALKIDERQAGKVHPFVALALNLLGVAALQTGSLDKAEENFRRMADIYQKVFGQKDKHVALGLLRFGELHEARKDYPRAEQFLRESVQLYSQTLSPENVQTGTARIALGRVLLRERRYQEAETELLAGYRIVTPGRSPSLQAAVDARRSLVSLYDALNMPNKAAEFRTEDSSAEHDAIAKDILQPH
ncbi:MAG TPA: tetratricopeptide repeat protein [Bryobacteraceae bacterium]|nr:tetratricopeptide repeat protein [Bryobacteraceae bacterium]